RADQDRQDRALPHEGIPRLLRAPGADGGGRITRVGGEGALSIRRCFGGGSDGNEQLTAIVATLLLVLLAIEGATLLNLQSLLTMHAFVGMLLIPVVALKVASTG